MDAPDDIAGLELIPLLERERWQIMAALLGSVELMWPELGDLIGVSLADRYDQMTVAEKRDVTRQAIWLMTLVLPQEPGDE